LQRSRIIEDLSGNTISKEFTISKTNVLEAGLFIGHVASILKITGKHKHKGHSDEEGLSYEE